MRPSEYTALKWQDIDWERGTVSVKRTLTKGSIGWAFGETKRIGSRRVIKLQNWVIALLKQLKQSCDHERVADLDEFADAGDLVFLSEFGRPINLNSLVYKHFEPILKRTGLPIDHMAFKRRAAHKQRIRERKEAGTVPTYVKPKPEICQREKWNASVRAELAKLEERSNWIRDNSLMAGRDSKPN